MPRVQATIANQPNEARERIITGARRHFLAHGFRSVTMDDLADELGMSKKTLYANFASKVALVEAVLLHKFHELQTELGEITSDCSTDFLATLHRLLATMQRHAAEVQPRFVRDIQREAPDLFHLVEDRRAMLIQRYFGKLFTAGRRAGMIRKDIPVRLIIEVLLSATHAIMNPPQMANLGITPKAGYLAIITIVLEGILSPSARRKR